MTGKIKAGRSVILTCERHLNDLKRAEAYNVLATNSFPYIFDEKKADRILKFAGKLLIAEGTGKPKNLKLSAFQKFILGSLFGWVHRETGYRRFRQSYVQVSRQQGKSVLNGLLGVYSSNFAGYRYAQINIAATKLKQSKIVYNEMVKFIEADPELSETFKIQDYKSTIQALLTKSTVTALSRDDKLDGFRSFLGILDEYHQHATDEIYLALLYGQRTLPECLLSIITTAGEDFTAPCYSFYEYCLKVLEQPESNEQLFIYIAQMDPDDDIWNPDNWIKCMPLIDDIPGMKENIIPDAHKARAVGGKELSTFLTKVFNIWCVAGDTQFVNPAKWKKAASNMSLEDMRGRECYVGIDLSGGGVGDLCSVGLEFPLDKPGHFFLESQSFMAKEHLAAKMQGDDVPYNKWANDGLITLTAGYKTDFEAILQYLRDVKAKYDIRFRMICYDAHNINRILNELDLFGCDVVEVTQSAKSLNEAVCDFKLSVEEGTMHYNKKNELLTWSALSSKLEFNSFGECKLEKRKSTKRIDPVDAIIDAHKHALLLKENWVMTGEEIDEMYADYV
ncbi:terminase large subunit [Paenibacillus sp. MAH-36]|uniref:Terminase TerL endonuclease subunit n=1 Tax=Paenibacillus violae TaxID=3077234 RepID=A0ABU3R7A9_9BACL|nr:terminase TerL endonuclease subunit [Paenibacillus sp. PFR10]MDU0200156.1 terminase TerL endonuclease subunit [Paenibacillus sp. PFR10]